MWRLLFVLALTVIVATVAFEGFALAQSGSGCEGLKNASTTQQEATLPEQAVGEETVVPPGGVPLPSQGAENSAVGDVAKTLKC